MSLRHLDLHTIWTIFIFLLFFWRVGFTHLLTNLLNSWRQLSIFVTRTPKKVGQIMCKSRYLGEIWSYTKIDQLFTKTTKNQTNQRLVRYCVNPNVSVKFGFTQKWTNFSKNIAKNQKLVGNCESPIFIYYFNCQKYVTFTPERGSI